MNLITNALLKITAALLLVAGVATQAEEKKSVDPTGTWTWSMQGRNGESREVTLKLKKEGDKLTGVMPGRNNNEVAIENGKVEGDQISFTITREFNGNRSSMKYSGKVSGDTITGKVESERGGESRSRDWTAKRKAEEKKS